jgi:hypothetical protein
VLPTYCLPLIHCTADGIYWFVKIWKQSTHPSIQIYRLFLRSHVIRMESGPKLNSFIMQIIGELVTPKGKK